MAEAKKQIMVWLPEELLTQVDARVAAVGGSRTAWMERVCRWALKQAITPVETGVPQKADT